jgi:predicted TIM-barrel fold metal-dependent hydrolase
VSGNGTMGAVPAVVDADQHLFESRTCWADHADPADREHALAIVDDEVGTAWLTWRGRRIGLAHVTVAGDTEADADAFRRSRAGEPPAVHYDDALPRDYWKPSARLDRLDTLGVDEAVLFPNYGLLWERELADDLRATTVNMGAWNRWTLAVTAEGRHRLHPVAHLTLRDLDWLDAQLRALATGGVRLAKIAPGLVDGRRLSDPALDRAWSLFVEHGVTPVFHVANTIRPFDDAWYEPDPEPTIPVLTSVFLWVPAALALSDLVLNGVLERHPELRIGIMELSAVWLPMFLQYLDGGVAFNERLVGSTIVDLPMRPSEYVRRQVRVAAFSYEQPERLARHAGDVFMACSDWPHAEGTPSPLADYRAAGSEPTGSPGLFADNIGALLGR